MTETTSPPTNAAPKVPRLAAIVNVIGFIAGIATVVLTALDVDSSLRIAAAITLFVLGPGSGIIQFIRIRDAALQLGLIVSVSAAIDIIVGQLFLFFNTISGLTAAIILTVITCIRPIYSGTDDEPSTTEEAK